MTIDEIFDSGRSGFEIGWKAIPPCSVTVLFRGACYVWMGGWHTAKEGLDATGSDFIGLSSESFIATLSQLRKGVGQ